MTDLLRKQDLEGILFFDIETVSRTKPSELDVDSKEFSMFQWKHRDKVTGDLLTEEETTKLYAKTAALYPGFNKIVCISVGFLRGDTFYVKAIRGEQKDIIEKFYTILNEGTKKRDWVPCGYNIIGFDLPTTRIKAIESKVEILLKDKFSDSMKKPWNLTDTFIDLMDVMKGTYFNNLSLDEACFLAGVHSPKDDGIDGSQVTEVYYSEGDERISKYCSRDVVAVAELLCNLVGEEGRIVNVVDKTEDDVEVKKQGVLHRIYNQSAITNNDKKELKALLGGKKLTKKDKTILVDMLHQLSVNSEMFKGDKEEVKAEKLEEAKKLIGEL